ncbi:MAG: hypothetical protein ACPG4X_22465, partial [Pikeienuella sp.]
MTDISPEAVERLASIEDNGGCADLQFTWYAHTLRALSARVAELEAEVANTRAALPAPEVTVAEAVPEVVTYTNWRGETSTRSIIPKHVW